MSVTVTVKLPYELHVGDTPQINATIYSPSGQVANLLNSTVRCLVTDPSDVTTVFNCSLVGTGETGQAYFVMTEGYLDVEGHWRMEFSVVPGVGRKFTSSVVKFYVSDTLPAPPN